MQKVCIVADCIDDQYAGIYTYATELIAALEKVCPADIEITYVHYRENDFFKGRRELIIPMGKKWPGRATVRKFFVLPHILKKKKFDLVHDLYHIAPFPFKKSSYKKVLTIHDLSAVLFPEYHVPQGFWIQRFVLPLMMKNADEIITVSEYTKSDIATWYNRKTHVTAIPLATRKFPQSTFIPLEQHYILCVGTIEPRKNIETLICAYELLKDHGYQGQLVLVGKKGWKCEYIFEMIDQSRWKKDISWKGYVYLEELDGYYRNAEVFVYPSVYEGFGLPLLEAMHYGVPVIAGWNSSLKEVMGDAGLNFQPTLPVALFDRLRTMLLKDDSEHTRHIYGEKAKKRAEKFTWEKTATQTLDVYKKLLMG